MGVKSHEQREDFIKLLSSMSHNDINDYIKRNGKKPKPVLTAVKLTGDDNNAGQYFRIYTKEYKISL